MKRAISFEKEHLPVFVMFAYSRHKEGMKFVQNLDRTKNASIDTSESSSVRVRGYRDIQTTFESLLSTNRILHRLNITSPWCTFAFTIVEALVREHFCSSQYHQLTGIIYVADIVFHHS